MKKGKVYLVGAGPGGVRDMTRRAQDAICSCDVLCGYTVYIDLILAQMPEMAGKRILTTPMRHELERCKAALEEASMGNDVAVICSGDAGIYGMAGPVLELMDAYPDAEMEVIPGITAAISGAAVLGAPLMNDFCVISLSDLLTPWDVIALRLRSAAMGDFTTVLYNPMSRKRTEHLKKACGIFLEYRDPDTMCGWVRNISRPGQAHKILTLQELQTETVDMFTTVFIGNSSMRHIGARLIAPRGYLPGVLLFGGTTEGRRMAGVLSERGFPVTVCVASETGAEYLEGIPGLAIETGRKDAAQMAELMREGYSGCIDATHPYAVEATKTIREACSLAGIPCYRLLREEYSREEVMKQVLKLTGGAQILIDRLRITCCTSAGEACSLLMETESGAITDLMTTGEETESGTAPGHLKTEAGTESGTFPVLLTTGAKEASCFTPLLENGAEVYIRVLSSEDSIRSCLAAGFPKDRILTGHGPYSLEENVRVLQEHGINVLVTKDGGMEGGFPQKLAAAALCGCRVIVISRPHEEGMSEEEILQVLTGPAFGQ